jgi:hypothetical protein
MGRIYTGLATWNLLFLAASFVLGFLRGGAPPAVDPRVHLLSGLFAAIFCCLVHAIVFAHFIGSGKWIREGVEAAGMDPAIVRRTKRFKGKVFPFALFSMLFAVATAVLGGGADSGATSAGLHLGLAVGTLALNVVATLFERSAIVENAGLIDRVATANAKRVEAGIQATLTPAGTLDAARAGSKVFLFLSANVWFAYGYLRFVMRRAEEPVVPYLVASAVLLFLGLRMKSGVPPAPPPDDVPSAPPDPPPVSPTP